MALAIPLAICVLALLLPLHRQPLPHFATELLFAVGALLCVSFALRKIKRAVFRVDGVAVLLTLTAVVTIAQVAQGTAELSDALMFCGYMFLAMIFYQAGCTLGSNENHTAKVAPIAWTILVAALLSSICGALQLTRSSFFSGWIYQTNNVMYGNLAQANHFNDLMWLGIVSAVFLVTERRLSRWSGAGFITLLVASSVLSGSRSGIVYSCLLTLVPLGLALRSRGGGAWRDCRLAFFLAPLYLLMLFAFLRLDVADNLGLMGMDARFEPSAAGYYALSAESRFHLWFKLLAQMQWAGVGVGSFQDVMRFQPDFWLTTGFRVPPEHAHNELIETGFEFGLGVMLVAMLLVIRWAWRRRTHVFNPADYWALGILMVIGTHSMLEYPLRYIYFLCPFCVALGFLSRLAAPFTIQPLPRGIPIVSIMAAFMVLFCAFRHFYPNDKILFQLQSGQGFGGRDKASVFAEIDKVPSASPFKRYASLIKGLVANPEDIQRGVLVTDCDNVVRVWMSARSIGNCAASYMLNGSFAKAESLLNTVCISDPDRLREVVQRLTEITGASVLFSQNSACNHKILN